MSRDFFYDTCFFNRLAYCPLSASLGETFSVSAFKKPLNRMHRIQIFSNTADKHIAQGYITIFATFAISYMHHTATKIHIRDSRVDALPRTGGRSRK